MAGAGFTRRFTYYPSIEEIAQIEGPVIVDLPTPGPITGASYGVAAVVGETTDMRTCCSVNSLGVVISSMKPSEVYGSSDVIDKIGAIDYLIGDHGDEQGNLGIEIRNKRFSRLIVQAVDILQPSTGSQYGIRVWRQLPTNRSATDPTPISAITGTQIPAGTEFRDGSNRVKLAQPVAFSSATPRCSGVDGTTTVGSEGSGGSSTLPGALREITRGSGSWITDGVKVGDIFVVGSLASSASTQNGACAAAGCLRVVSVDSATVVTVQRLDGSNFTENTTWRAGSALAYRVYPAAVADSGGQRVLSNVAGYTVLARPCTATVSAATALTPSPAPTAPSSTYWGPTAGLMGVTHPSGALTYEAALHAAGLASGAVLRARYLDALNALLNDVTPINEIRVVTCARKDPTIQSYLRDHGLQASARGLTRSVIVSPPLSVLSKSTVLSETAPGVGGNGGALRDERVWYSWPGVQTTIPELIGVPVALADGTTSETGNIDTTADTWVAALLTKLRPELNPGQADSPVPEVFAPITGYQSGCPTLDMSDYILFKQYGVIAFRNDRVSGWILQSNVTTSLENGKRTINRRRMADWIQDTLAALVGPMAKKLARESVTDSILAVHDDFFSQLKSEGAPEQARIKDYRLDDSNQGSNLRNNIWVVRHKVDMISTLDNIVTESTVGPDGTISISTT